MAEPYLCPNCKTNKSRFNIIEQSARSVRLDPDTGDILEEYREDNLAPFHLPYQGPDRKVQCAVCGLIEDEQAFIKRAAYMNKS
ncbi:DNA alkylation repair protein [Camelliibacillus cellulosilyticus]|uniref:DNA alkylation repair protein n=1 Tax=Camelliibacillus cellulosilyticus TaxID=2174486 RepID=A0ABV9GM39_9BACL